MNVARASELSFRTIRILATSADGLRQRLPWAWDHGMSLIDPDTLPENCSMAIRELRILRDELSRETNPYTIRCVGAARGSLSGRHNSTLEKLAERMMSVHADLEQHYENMMRGTHQ